jgi:hypothetical protein
MSTEREHVTCIVLAASLARALWAAGRAFGWAWSSTARFARALRCTVLRASSE